MIQLNIEALTAEKKQLDDNLRELCSFTRSYKFDSVPFMEQERMNMQKHLMLSYSAILGERIAYIHLISDDKAKGKK